MWFKQNIATIHTADATLALMWERFSYWIIARWGFVNWTPRSSDLTALDCCFWDYCKSISLCQHVTAFTRFFSVCNISLSINSLLEPFLFFSTSNPHFMKYRNEFLQVLPVGTYSLWTSTRSEKKSVLDKHFPFSIQ